MKLWLLAWIVGACCVGTAWVLDWLERRGFDRQMDRIREEWKWMD
jgi:hypothetical protein